MNQKQVDEWLAYVHRCQKKLSFDNLTVSLSRIVGQFEPAVADQVVVLLSELGHIIMGGGKLLCVFNYYKLTS